MFEAYSVAVRLSLVGNLTSGLMALSRQFAHVHGGAVGLRKELDRIKLTLLAGGALAGTGVFGLAMIGKTVHAAKEYAHQLAQLNTVGMTHLEIVRATQAAWRTSYSTPTSTAAENLATIREFRGVFGKTGHAIENMPAIQRLQAVLTVLRGGHSAAHDEAYIIARALETKGAIQHPAEFMTQANAIAKAMVAFGGKVTGTDFLGAFKYGRGATQWWSDDFAYTILPTLIQELKGAGGGGRGGPGSALMSAYAAVVGGAVPQKALKVWQRLGLLDTSKVEWTHAGEAKGLRPGGIKGWEIFQRNPFEFAQKVLIPALHHAGITKDRDIAQTLQYLFPKRNAGFVMSQMVTQGWKFERDQRIIRGASNLSAYQQLLNSDPLMAELALQKQWQNLMTALGYQIMPPLIKATLKLMEVLRPIGQWLYRHQTITQLLVYSFMALSGVMAISGMVMLVTAAFRALGLVPIFAMVGAGGPVLLIAAGLVALGAAIYELYTHWKEVEDFFNPSSWNFNPSSWNFNPSSWNFGQDPKALAGVHYGDNGETRFVPRGGAAAGRGGAANVYMDGHKVGKIISGHQAGAARQQQGTSFFDSTQSPPLPSTIGVF
ncbi:MAG: hypothetical protein GC190_21925 [Alphaproteobacteria bacterium]|nr:hypothetical protein [Alphaproteobacteria bacterium]